MPFLRDFRKFVMRGNLVDLAVGFTVGAAFTTIAKSIVDDIVMPPMGLMLGRSDFTDFFVVIQAGRDGLWHYDTLARAKAAGAVTINYGLFVNHLLAFLLVGLAMFVVSRAMARAEARLEAQFDRPPSSEPQDKKCPFCRSVIAYQAIRCPQCTSHLDAPGAAAQHRPDDD